MGLYIRKSLRVGPLRFNLSKSGVGVSGGIKGLRLGSGPRGNYVHMGRGGLYYRSTFSGKKRTQEPISPTLPSDKKEDIVIEDPMKEIESVSISQISDSSSENLLKEINNKNKKIRLWPGAIIVCLAIFFFLLFQDFPKWSLVVAGTVSMFLIFLAHRRDIMSKTTVLFYDLEEDVANAYEKFHETFQELVSCSRTWHIEAEGNVKDKKYAAGADTLIRRKSVNLSRGEPPYIKTNIEVPCIPVGKQKLYFFPDRLLIFEKSEVGAISYPNLKIDIEQTRFIEEESVPRDSKVVDHTWRYVNKRGGPDKRFKDNPQLPIVLYQQMDFTSKTGLNERIQLSKISVGENLINSISDLEKFSALT